MCTPACIEFTKLEFARTNLANVSVLEVGSFDVNGSVRGAAEQYAPQRYVGVDIANGPGVDVVCAAGDLVEMFGEESFDVVVSTEMLEHVPDWKSAIMQMKRVLRPGGSLILTTRSPGFHLHGYPADFWRFSAQDMRVIFADLDDLCIASDRVQSPGVFVSGTKSHREPTSLEEIAIYSIVSRRRRQTANRAEIAASKALIYVKGRVNALPGPVKQRVLHFAGGEGRKSTH